MRASHAQQATYYHFQTRFVANLEKVHQRGAATSYELAQTRSRLEMTQGSVESLQPSMDLLSLEQRLQTQIREIPFLRDMSDLGAAGNELLTEIASTRQRPNPGVLLRMNAMHEFASRRAQKMAPLVKKGFATPLELAEIERSRDTYLVIAQSELDRELAVAPAAAIVGQPKIEKSVELPDLTILPLE